MGHKNKITKINISSYWKKSCKSSFAIFKFKSKILLFFTFLLDRTEILSIVRIGFVRVKARLSRQWNVFSRVQLKNVMEAFFRTNFIKHFRTKFIWHFRTKFIKHLRTNCTTSFRIRTKSVLSENQIIFCISFTMHVVNSCLSEFLSDHINSNVTQQKWEKT